MAKKDLKNKVSELLLTGPGLDVTMIATDNVIKSYRQQTPVNEEAMESLYDLRRQVRLIKIAADASNGGDGNA